MLKNLSFRTTLVTAITASLAISVVATIATIALAIAGLELPAAIAATAGFIGVAGCAFVAAREVEAVETKIDEAAAAANELAQRLPQIAGATFADGGLPPFEPFRGEGHDSSGRVIAALNAIQEGASAQATAHRVSVREGVSSLVVNLVRRNQGLLERQIDHIDRLEASEEDPDRLEELYGVDHLSTRMRRNAESLLVLAGSEPQRRKGEPVSINDLMRVAMGEIEGYRNVRLTRADGGHVGAQPALDVAHLLSELLENATQFSPPNAQVELAGSAQADGSYLVSIADHGIGMSDELIAETNDLLFEPPDLNLGLGRSLGFLVVARLAQRLNVTVELADTPGGTGVTALVLLPQALLTGPKAAKSARRATALEKARRSDDTVAATPAPPRAAPPEVSQASAAAATAESATDDPDADRSEDTEWADGVGWADDDDPESDEPQSVPAMGVDVDSLDDEPAWTPPTIPERRGGDSLFEDPDGTAAQPAGDHNEEDEPVQSEALAKLLGVPADTADAGDPADAADPPDAEQASDQPERLEEAIPTGESFDAGVASLLDDDGLDEPDEGGAGQRNRKGLAKRDRSRSHAPASEGRVIPNKGRSATASTRNPEEIRNLLSSYRDARSGNAPDGTAPPADETASGEES